MGSIVNCASVNSVQAGAGTSGYTTAKHGVPGITKTVSNETPLYLIVADVKIGCLGRKSPQRPSQRSLSRFLPHRFVEASNEQRRAHLRFLESRGGKTRTRCNVERGR